MLYSGIWWLSGGAQFVFGIWGFGGEGIKATKGVFPSGGSSLQDVYGSWNTLSVLHVVLTPLSDFLLFIWQCNILVEVRDFKHAQSVKWTLESAYSDVLWNSRTNENSLHNICNSIWDPEFCCKITVWKERFNIYTIARQGLWNDRDIERWLQTSKRSFPLVEDKLLCCTSSSVNRFL